MIFRDAIKDVVDLLSEFPAVGVLGPRQVGKTSLANHLLDTFSPRPIYLDLETPSDMAKVIDPEAYFERHKGTLIILDEIQRIPDLFQVLRGVIDRRRREGFRTGQFLVLGSASLDLLKQSSETLAGRIAYKHLGGLNGIEVQGIDAKWQDSLWLRGGFPDSYLARSDAASYRWRSNFISTYLEREVPQLGPRIPAVTLRRLWTMLAHMQCGMLNVAQLGAGQELPQTTTKRYLELLEDLLLIRTLPPWAGNIGKRLVKAPKVYIRDSGITHTLLKIQTLDDLMGHPVVGGSWEGFVIENLLSCLPEGVIACFYRTSAGAEIDLVIDLGNKKKIAIEVKRSLAPKVSKGFHLGCDDIQATQRLLVYPGKEQYSLGNGVMAMPMLDLMKELAGK